MELYTLQQRLFIIKTNLKCGDGVSETQNVARILEKTMFHLKLVLQGNKKALLQE